MATIPEAIVTALTDNWAAGGGTVKFLNSAIALYPGTPNQETIFVKGYSLNEEIDPQTLELSNITFLIDLDINTIDSTDKETRLNIIIEEARRILNSGAVTGFSTVKVIAIDRRITVQDQHIYRAVMTVALAKDMVEDGTGVGTVDVDFEIQGDLQVDGDANIDGDVTIGQDLTVTGNIVNPTLTGTVTVKTLTAVDEIIVGLADVLQISERVGGAGTALKIYMESGAGTDQVHITSKLGGLAFSASDGGAPYELLIEDDMVTFGVDGTIIGDLNIGGEIKFDTAILHAQANDFHMHPASGNADIKLVLHPLGTNTKSFLQVRNTVNPANYGGFEFTIDGAVASLNSVSGGSGTKPTTLNINDADWDTINIGDASCDTTLGGDVEVSGDLTVTGNDINTPSSTSINAITGVVRIKLNGVEKIYVGATSTIIKDDLQANNDILTESNKSADVGATGTAWDNMYADDYVNESPFKQIENPLSVVKAIQEKEGKLDYESLPDWVRATKRINQVTEIDKDGIKRVLDEGVKVVAEKGFSINRMCVLLYQALQEATTRIEALES